MKNNIIKKTLTAIFFIGAIAVLKFYFDKPNLAIAFLLLIGALLGIINLLIKGFLIPSSKVYRFRYILLGVLFGVFISIMIFGMESIENGTFIMKDLILYLLIGSFIGGFFIRETTFRKLERLKREQGFFLNEQQLVKDSARLLKQEGQSIEGQLVLTKDYLIFIDNYNVEKVLETSVSELNPTVNTTKYFVIPNGLKLESCTTVIKVPFPYYWLKQINKIKANNAL